MESSYDTALYLVANRIIMCFVACGLRHADVLTVKDTTQSLINPRRELKDEWVHVADRVSWLISKRVLPTAVLMTTQVLWGIMSCRPVQVM
jgi:hypothetical protein